ncbi:MAG TPA: hypothetical protein VMU65_07765 [Candidatus Saccharimonadales bacterium]|nr:hypothetical protein [Candidatus Saccharimonadales bacterium]
MSSVVVIIAPARTGVEGARTTADGEDRTRGSWWQPHFILHRAD